MTSSNSAVQWQGRSHVSTFVHSLHLLDFDQRQDWPGVNIQSFGPKSNLQHRVRCIEWSLYRLFELYDAQSTKDKLRPFFPPATSLQSVNLRAALLRQLTELKKYGVLGPNIILRKTMLDECKGDKFEELLAAFSVIVLKKVTNTKVKVQKENQIPLILSYRKGIQRDLEKRKEIELNARQQHRTIKASQAVWTDQATALRYRKPPKTPENADLIRSILRENWIGDYNWTETILNGIPLRSDETQDNRLEGEGEAENENASLLEDLQARVRTQNVHLVKWQAYLKTLQQQHQHQPSTGGVSVGERLDKAPSNNFERHRDLRRFANRDTIQPAEPCLKSHHSILLESLEKELNSTSGAMQAPAPNATPRSLRSVRPPHIDMTPVKAATTQPCRSMSRGRQSSESPPEHHTSQPESPTTPKAPQQHSLLERTRMSLASFETPKAVAQTSQKLRPQHSARAQTDATILAVKSHTRDDRSSLLERTRQSMSMLTNVLDDPWGSQLSKKSSKPTHKRSKTLNIAPQRGRLSRAWSEESLSSAATSKDDSFNYEAEYEDVFKSRPRLAMSPNLSPQRTDSDAWLESQLEQSMNKLTIDSSPEY